jgi:hypothetical protein
METDSEETTIDQYIDCQYKRHYIGESYQMGIRDGNHFIERFRSDHVKSSRHYIAARECKSVFYFAIAIVDIDGQDGREKRSFYENIFCQALHGLNEQWIVDARAKYGLPSIRNSKGVNGILPGSASRLISSKATSTPCCWNYTIRSFDRIIYQFNSKANEAETTKMTQWINDCLHLAESKKQKHSELIAWKKKELLPKSGLLAEAKFEILVKKSGDRYRTSFYNMTMKQDTYTKLADDYRRIFKQDTPDSFVVLAQLSEAKSDTETFHGIDEASRIMYGCISLTIRVSSDGQSIPWIMGNVGPRLPIVQEDNAKRIFELLSEESQTQRLSDLSRFQDVDSDEQDDILPQEDLLPTLPSLELNPMATSLYYGTSEVRFETKTSDHSTKLEAHLKYAIDVVNEDRMKDTRRLILEDEDAAKFQEELNISGLPRPIYHMRAKFDTDFGIFRGQKDAQERQLMSSITLEIEKQDGSWSSLSKSRHYTNGQDLNDALLEIQEQRLEAGLLKLKHTRQPNGVLCEEEPIDRPNDLLHFKITEADVKDRTKPGKARACAFIAIGGFKDYAIPAVLVDDFFLHQTEINARIKYKIDATGAKSKEEVKVSIALISGGDFVGVWFDLLQSQSGNKKSLSEGYWKVVEALKDGKEVKTRKRNPNDNRGSKKSRSS